MGPFRGGVGGVQGGLESLTLENLCSDPGLIHFIGQEKIYLHGCTALKKQLEEAGAEVELK